MSESSTQGQLNRQNLMHVLMSGIGFEHLSVFNDALQLVKHLLSHKAFLPDHRVLFVV